MEKNYINFLGTTQFYFDLVNKEYGVLISLNDTPKANEIIEKFRKKQKKLIEAWKKEWNIEQEKPINTIKS